MELYTGIDIVDLFRFEKIVQRYGPIDFNNRFLLRVFDTRELELILPRAKALTSLAGRFAGKESVIKAFAPLKKLSSYRDIVILGEVPRLESPRLRNYKVSISITHDGNYAVACTSLLYEGE